MTETCKISDLLTNPYNREIDPAKVAHIKAEIQRTGKVYPLVYSEVDNDGKPGKMVTDGHHRFAALKELGHTEVPIVLSDKRGLDTKAPKEEVEKHTSHATGGSWLRHEDKWVLYSHDNRRVGEADTLDEIRTQQRMLEYILGNQVEKFIRHEGSKWTVRSHKGKPLGSYSSKEEAVTRLRQIEYFKHNKMSQDELTTEVRDLAKAWFGDPERHAEAARHDGISTVADSKVGTHEGLKTAVKVAAIGALAVGGIAALRSSTFRSMIASKAEQLFGGKTASKLGISTAEATLANGGHTVSLAGKIPNARYMVSPYKANEKIIPVGQFKAHSIDAYTKQNASLLAQPNHHLGTWHNKETGNVHLDVSLPHDNRLAALETGQKHGQLAIYDRVAGHDIPVNPETIAQAKFVETIRGAHEATPHSWNPHISREGGFGTDTLHELSQAVKTGQSAKPIRLLYNAKNGNFIVGPFESSHELMLTQIPGTPGELDRHWARMVYQPEKTATGNAGKLELWDWSTAADEAKGTAARNYADTAESIMRNKAFTDDTLFSIHEPFKQKMGRATSDSLEGITHTLGEWRQLYGKSAKGILTYNIDSLMKNAKETKAEEATIPNRTAMAAEEQAEHPTLPAETIAQIVEDHLKVGKDIIYKRAMALAISKSLAKSFKPKPKAAKEQPIDTTDTKDSVTKPEEPASNTLDNTETKPEPDNKPETSNVNREVPSEVFAQPNTQESIEQASSVDETLVELHGAIQELEMIARDQQMMSEDEMQLIIIPLQEKVSLLLNALKGGTLEESATETQNPEEVPDEQIEETADEVSSDIKEPLEDTKGPEDPQRKRKKPQGPPRKPGTGTAERELNEPADNFVGKSDTNQTVSKAFFGMGGGQRGWRGDPAGHAEAARERWAGEGVPPGGKEKPTSTRRAAAQQTTGPATPTQRVSDTALVLPRAVKDLAVKTASRAGRSLARAAGDTIAQVGWQAFGTVAGLVLYRYLAGKATNPAALATLGVSSLKRAINDSFRMQRVAALTSKIKMAQKVKAWAGTAESVIGAGKAAAGTAKVSRTVKATARAIKIASKLKSKV